MCLRGRSHREVKDLATSMIVNLSWPIVSTNQHAEVREAMPPDLRPAERLMLRTQTSLDKTLCINRTLAVHDQCWWHGSVAAADDPRDTIQVTAWNGTYGTLCMAARGVVNLLSVEALIRQAGGSTDRDRSFRLPPFP